MKQWVKGWCQAVLVFVLVALSVTGQEAELPSELDRPGYYDWDTYLYYKDYEVASLQDLASDYVAQQWAWMPLAFPEDVPWGWTQVADPNPMPFVPAGFPKTFFKGLLPRHLNGVMVFPVYVWEDPKTRDRVFVNANQEEIASLPAERDYDPTWWVYALFNDADRAAWSGDDWRRYTGMFDSSRLVIRYNLILDRQLQELVYVPEEANASLMAAKSNGGGEMLLMRLLAAETDIIIQSASVVSNNVKLEIAYPNDFTNRLEIYATTNLSDYDWSLAATNLATTGTNAIFWTDTGTTNYFRRFYAAGNADLDTDGDGLVDGREKYLYGSSMTERDSDSDGLVDGYSGVVGTNVYPGGARTNGGTYVEGELTWYTDVLNSDTDDDGMGDGWEVSNGHNPLDPNDPPNVSGAIFYAGRQTGMVWVVAVTNDTSWATNHCQVLCEPGLYRLVNLPGTNYWIRSYRDSDGNSTFSAMEANGITSNSLWITNRVIGVDVTLLDPDSDSDGLPDWWESANGLSPTNAADAALDPDGDEYTSGEEYAADTDPQDEESHPWNINGTVGYTGGQTGVIWVVATLSDGDGTVIGADVLEAPGSYAITHLHPYSNYCVEAFRDSNGNASNDYWEARAEYANNPVDLNTNVTGIDITLADPDTDNDGLPDWWELDYGLDPDYGGEDVPGAWWKLDEATGTNVADSTSASNQGWQCNMASNSWGMGVISNALAFDGTDDYVQFNDSTSLKPGYVSVGLWAKPSLTLTNGTAVFYSKKPVGTNTGYELLYEQGKLTFRICASGAKSAQYACTLTNSQWRHIAGTYGGQALRLYVDGILRAETNFEWGTSFGYVDQDATKPRLGATTGATPSNYWAGSMDDVRVHGMEWSSNQVVAIWQLGADFDLDGLSNFDEFHAGTCPTNSDTDGDGISDGAEVHVFGTDPLHMLNSILPFTAGFESTNGYVAGILDGQQGWTATEGVAVQSFAARSGFQAVQSAGLAATYVHGLASTATVVTAETWVYWNPTQTVPPTNLPSGATALVSFNATAGVVAFDGDGQGGGTWVAASNTLLVSQWVALKVEQNYATKTWNLYVNGIEKLTGLKFKDDTPARLRAINIRDGTGGPLVLDDLRVEAEP